MRLQEIINIANDGFWAVRFVQMPNVRQSKQARPNIIKNRSHRTLTRRAKIMKNIRMNWTQHIYYTIYHICGCPEPFAHIPSTLRVARAP